MRTLIRAALLALTLLLTGSGPARAQATFPFPGGAVTGQAWSLMYYNGEPALVLVIGNGSSSGPRFLTQFLAFTDRESPVSFTVLAAGYIDLRSCAPGSPVFLSKRREAWLETYWEIGQLDGSGLLVYAPATPHIQLDATESAPEPVYLRRFFNSGYCGPNDSCPGKCFPGRTDSPDVGVLILRVTWR
jgi:hypothetical protein